MIFILEYNRSLGKLISFQSFDDSEWKRAEELRFERELYLFRVGIDNEVVLLEAASEKILRRTHRRYFEDLEQLATLPEAA